MNADVSSDPRSFAFIRGYEMSEKPWRPTKAQLLAAHGKTLPDVVARATAAADELEHAEFVAGGKKLVAKLKKFTPRVLAVLGVGAYRAAFDRPRAIVGLQDDVIGGTRLWVLPN